MKQLIQYIFTILVATIVLAYLLDIIYTYTYNHGAYRNKAMWVRNMDGKDSLDFIILGSSRAHYFIDPVQIEKETGKKGLNLGINAFTGIEMYILLEDYLKRRKVAQVFVQVDSKYTKHNPDQIGEKVWIPYIKEPDVYKQFKPHGKLYRRYHQIPFYRYAKFESRLGFRNVLPSLMGKGVSYEPTKGFSTYPGVLTEEKPYIADRPITSKNKYYEQMVALCNENGVQLVFFTSPIYKFEGDLSPLQTYLPNYFDMKDVVTQRSYFADQTHLNAKGAKVFTSIFAQNFLLPKP